MVIAGILDPQFRPGIQRGEFANSPGGVLVPQGAGDALAFQQAENLLYDNQLRVGEYQLHGGYKGQLDSRGHLDRHAARPAISGRSR